MQESIDNVIVVTNKYKNALRMVRETGIVSVIDYKKYEDNLTVPEGVNLKSVTDYLNNLKLGVDIWLAELRELFRRGLEEAFDCGLVKFLYKENADLGAYETIEYYYNRLIERGMVFKDTNVGTKIKEILGLDCPVVLYANAPVYDGNGILCDTTVTYDIGGISAFHFGRLCSSMDEISMSALKDYASLYAERQSLKKVLTRNILGTGYVTCFNNHLCVKDCKFINNYRTLCVTIGLDFVKCEKGN